MVYTTLQDVRNCESLSFQNRLKRAVEYLFETDFSKMERGTYELDGKNLYAMVQEYETSPVEEGKWETHDRYIDLQYMEDGEETFGVQHRHLLQPVTDYKEEADYTLYQGEGNFLTLTKGDMLILWPEDAHMPGRTRTQVQKVKKVVIKIKLG